MLGTNVESSLAVTVTFWVLAASTIIAAIAVVHLKDLFRTSLFLVVAFIGVAGMFILLRAEFLAIVQLIIYVGAIAVLIIFAIMMTRDVGQGNPYNRIRIPAALVCGLFFISSVFVAFDTKWNLLDRALGVKPDGATGEGTVALSADAANRISQVYASNVGNIAEFLLRDYVLAFDKDQTVLPRIRLGLRLHQSLARVRHHLADGHGRYQAGHERQGRAQFAVPLPLGTKAVVGI